MKNIIKLKEEKDILELLKTHFDSDKVYIQESGEVVYLSELIFGYDNQELTIEVIK